MLEKRNASRIWVEKQKGKGAQEEDLGVYESIM
jgi:hypothetical protein